MALRDRIESTDPIDFSIARHRRAFFLRRAMRLRTRGSGSDLERLMTGPRSNAGLMASKVFGTIPVMLVGAHAANAYMPPRHTADVDFLVPNHRFREAEKALSAEGWQRSLDLVFPNANLGLHGSAWSHQQTNEQLDLISSPQPWVEAAFDAPIVRAQDGARVLPLPFLVLMKLDSARTTDQGDLGRMLGRLDNAAVENVIAVVTKHYGDPQAADDIRQYAEIGRWEYSTETERGDQGRS